MEETSESDPTKELVTADGEDVSTSITLTEDEDDSSGMLVISEKQTSESDPPIQSVTSDREDVSTNITLTEDENGGSGMLVISEKQTSKSDPPIESVPPDGEDVSSSVALTENDDDDGSGRFVISDEQTNESVPQMETVTPEGEDVSSSVALTENDDDDDGSGMFVISDEQTIEPHAYYAVDSDSSQLPPEQMPVIVYENAEDHTDLDEVSGGDGVSTGGYHSTSLITTVQAGEYYNGSEFMVADGTEYYETIEPVPSEECVNNEPVVTTSMSKDPSFIYPVSLQSSVPSPSWTSKPFPVNSGLSRKFECERCGRFYGSVASLKTHKYRYQNCQPDELGVRKGTHVPEYGSGHEDDVIDLKPFKCHKCGKSYAALNNLHYHQEASKSCGVHASELRPYICERCGKKFKRTKYLQVHRKMARCQPPMHSRPAPPANQPFVCKKCGKRFGTLQGFRYHRSMSKSCALIGEARVSKLSDDDIIHEASAQDHEDSNSQSGVDDNDDDGDDQPCAGYKCQSCLKMYTNLKAFLAHLKIHKAGSKFQCDQCSRIFDTNVELRKHVRTVHLGLRYKCTFCDKKFTTSYWLKQHMRKHNSGQLQKCKYCPQHFTNPNSRKQHESLHFGFKHFNCMYCEGTFKTRAAVMTHMRFVHKDLHTGQTKQKLKTWNDALPRGSAQMASFNKTGKPSMQKYVDGNRLRMHSNSPHVDSKHNFLSEPLRRGNTNRRGARDSAIKYSQDDGGLDEGTDMPSSSRRTATRTIRAPKKYEEDYFVDYGSVDVKDEPSDEDDLLRQPPVVDARKGMRKKGNALQYDAGVEPEPSGSDAKKLPKFELTMKMLDNAEVDADEPIVIEVDYVITARRKKSKKKKHPKPEIKDNSSDLTAKPEVSPVVSTSRSDIGSVSDAPKTTSISMPHAEVPDVSTLPPVRATLHTMLPTLTSTIAQQESVFPSSTQFSTPLAHAQNLNTVRIQSTSQDVNAVRSQSNIPSAPTFLSLESSVDGATPGVETSSHFFQAASTPNAVINDEDDSQNTGSVSMESELAEEPVLDQVPPSDEGVDVDPDYEPGKGDDKHLVSVRGPRVPVRSVGRPRIQVEAAADSASAKYSFVCDKCGKRFASKVTLKEHQEVSRTCGHSRELRPFVCDTCGQGFTLKKYLAQHKVKTKCEMWAQVDIGDAELLGPPYVCKTCGNKFKKIQFLKFHMTRMKCTPKPEKSAGGTGRPRLAVQLSDNEEQTLKCDSCNDQLKTKYGLKKHKLSVCRPRSQSKCITSSGKVIPLRPSHMGIKRPVSTDSQLHTKGMRTSGWKFIPPAQGDPEAARAVQAIKTQVVSANANVSPSNYVQNGVTFVKQGTPEAMVPLDAAIKSLVLEEETYVYDDHDYGITYHIPETPKEKTDNVVNEISVPPVVNISSGVEPQLEFFTPEGDVIQPLPSVIEPAADTFAAGLPSTVLGTDEQLYRVEITDGVLTLVAMDDEESARKNSESPIEEYELEMNENGAVIEASQTGDVFLDEGEVLRLVQGAAHL